MPSGALIVMDAACLAATPTSTAVAQGPNVPVRCRSVPWQLTKSAQGTESPPLFAYYYIWFDVTSWERAKTDYPLLGRYSSDEECVMRQHIRWAQRSGINGFIVSWKSTDELNPRLEALASISAREDFRLAVIYQGLDFSRRPLPAERVKQDLIFFRDTFASMPAFAWRDPPIVIWSGSWEFSRAEIEDVTGALHGDLTILGSERSPEGYERIADLVDGNAYYWSSANPATYPEYPQRLVDLSRVVDRHDGLWIAPAAPGFDARLIGGSTVVPRSRGTTLRRSYEGAVRSDPDIVGLISWNEFSENTHIEPSEVLGMRYLTQLADLRGATVRIGTGFDSSAPQGARPLGQVIVTGATLLGAIVLVTAVAAQRRRAWRRDRQ